MKPRKYTATAYFRGDLYKKVASEPVRFGEAVMFLIRAVDEYPWGSEELRLAAQEWISTLEQQYKRALKRRQKVPAMSYGGCRPDCTFELRRENKQ